MRKFLLSTICVLAIALVPASAFAATQEVTVVNWPSAWSTAFANINSSLNTIKSDTAGISTVNQRLLTLNNQLGFSGNFNSTLADALGAMYDRNGVILDELHALNTTSSAIGSIDNQLIDVRSTLAQQLVALLNLESHLSDVRSGVISIGSDTSSIKSRIGSVTDTGSVIYYLGNQQAPIVSHLVNIDTQTAEVNAKLAQYLPVYQTQNSTLINYIDIIRTHTQALRDVYADADTVALKQATQSVESQVADDFVKPSGSASVKGSDFSSVKDVSAALSDNFDTGFSPSDVFTVFDTGLDNWGWFSNACYNELDKSAQFASSGGSGRRSAPKRSTEPDYQYYYAYLDYFDALVGDDDVD